eukprot:m.744215 g.744215  ORF g.744215 m.744215 type:complete len:58 (-) comp23123_c1_seq6:52-225(-)
MWTIVVGRFKEIFLLCTASVALVWKYPHSLYMLCHNMLQWRWYGHYDSAYNRVHTEL